MAVEKGKTVKIQYEGRLESGEVFDKSQQDSHLEFTAGEGKIIPGFEKAVIGMEKGEEKEITIPPEDAYGSRKDDLVRSVPRSKLPEGIKPEKGMFLESKVASGKTMPVKITEVNEEDIKIDFNHPLADQKLIFKIKVCDIS